MERERTIARWHETPSVGQRQLDQCLPLGGEVATVEAGHRPLLRANLANSAYSCKGSVAESPHLGLWDTLDCLWSMLKWDQHSNFEHPFGCHGQKEEGIESEGGTHLDQSHSWLANSDTECHLVFLSSREREGSH